EGADVRVIEAGDDARLAVETLAHVLVEREVALEDLDRDDAIEPGVAGAVDLAHTSGAQEAQDLVGAYRAACFKAHGRRESTTSARARSGSPRGPGNRACSGSS